MPRAIHADGDNDLPAAGGGLQASPPVVPAVSEPIRHLSLIRPGAPGRQRTSRTAFRRRFFGGVTPRDWDDWRWQLASSIRTPDILQRVISLTDDELAAFGGQGTDLPLAITPYYLSLVDPRDPTHPLRRCVIPTCHEHLTSPQEDEDPLGEERDSPVPGLVHRYPDRVLLLATRRCAAYCRYCTRSRLVGRSSAAHGAGQQGWERSLAYIREHQEVRDVLISGGDPLLLEDPLLESLLSALRRIPHVEIIRIGSRVPAVLPQRVTRDLVRMLHRYHPLWLSLHFSHPEELTPETETACSRLADAGIPLGSQTVLLAGINNDLQTLKTLFQSLLRLRVRPYYLYQCDPIRGSAHFRTPVAEGLELLRGLRGHTTGYAVPTFVIDAPGGGGKVPLLPRTCLGWDRGSVLLQNHEGNIYRYPDPVPPDASPRIPPVEVTP